MARALYTTAIVSFVSRPFQHVFGDGYVYYAAGGSARGLSRKSEVGYDDDGCQKLDKR